MRRFVGVGFHKMDSVGRLMIPAEIDGEPLVLVLRKTRLHRLSNGCRLGKILECRVDGHFEENTCRSGLITEGQAFGYY